MKIREFDSHNVRITVRGSGNPDRSRVFERAVEQTYTSGIDNRKNGTQSTSLRFAFFFFYHTGSDWRACARASCSGPAKDPCRRQYGGNFRCPYTRVHTVVRSCRSTSSANAKLQRTCRPFVCTLVTYPISTRSSVPTTATFRNGGERIFNFFFSLYASQALVVRIDLVSMAYSVRTVVPSVSPLCIYDVIPFPSNVSCQVFAFHAHFISDNTLPATFFLSKHWIFYHVFFILHLAFCSHVYPEIIILNKTCYAQPVNTILIILKYLKFLRLPSHIITTCL
jgi:hypothetical protein